MISGVYLSRRVFIILLMFAIAFALTILWSPLFYVVLIALIAFVGIIIYELYFVYRLRSQVSATRKIAEIISLSDVNQVDYKISNLSDAELYIEFIDEFPSQLQVRGFKESFILPDHDVHKFTIPIIPVTRGQYSFGDSMLFLSHPKIRLIRYRITNHNPTEVKVYPSIKQMKEYALKVFSQTATMMGVRKVRRRGENDEFEQLKKYAQGDNIKSINWKATSRIGELVVNQYQDSRSQNIYILIDKGRNMEMPFEGLSLLDYSINSALVMANIILKKYDKVGLITFDDKVNTFLKADDKGGQLDRVLKFLYKEETGFRESGYENLYLRLRHDLSHRSIILLYTNFESITDFQRNKEYLKLISRRHLLVVIIFENTELSKYTQETYSAKDEIYKDIIATAQLNEKERIIRELQLQGIQTILTKPADLSIKVINKYLDIKRKRQM